MKYHFSERDLEQIKDRGITLDVVEEQLESFKTGFPYLKIEKGAAVGEGIVRMSETECNEYAAKC